ncbi:toprim domain-containing protein [Cellulophaga baltica]|uniref:Toprim-like n=1 Tax=Cellulophaga baltica TaxID=76594 RepID=A0A1G7JNJ2_9FLAO|nr:toprim domain-containing protein [Cellulophaga baltica]SDF26528.1 Toprim-like [Cellulophaga baltica]
MNYQIAKKIDIVSYLKKIGKEPEKIRGNTAWFLSILRNETTASLKVDINKNLWYDFGAGIGGTIIDLLIHLHNFTAKEALDVLSNDTFLFHQQERPFKKEIKYSIKKVTDLDNEKLLAYLDERKINLDFARRFCCQVHYTFDNKKEYYAIGFKNDHGSYEVRNEFFKGCLGRKAITTIINNSQIVSLFESWSDFLSYLTLKKKVPNENYIILNSTSMVKNAVELVKENSKIRVFFDNDEAGNKATSFLLNSIKGKVIDYRIHYKKYNDLNEFLLARS